MADNEISAKITAEITGFTAGVQQAATAAQQSFDKIKVSAGGAGIAFDQLGAAARAQIQAAIGPVQQLGAAAQTAGAQVEAGMTTAAHGTAGLYREIIVLGHEVLVGNFNRIPGSMMVLAERSGNLAGIVGALANPFVVAGAAAAAMAGYLGYLAEQAISSANSIELLHDSLTLIGRGTSRTTADLTQFRDNLTSTFALSTKEATNLTTAFAGLPNVTQEEAAALASLAVEIAKARGEDLGDVAAEWGKAVSDGGNAVMKLAEKIGIQTGEAKENVATLEKSGQTSIALGTAINAVTSAVDSQVGAWTRDTAAVQNFTSAMTALGGLSGLGGIAAGAIPAQPPGPVPRHPPSIGPQTTVEQQRVEQEAIDQRRAKIINLQTEIDNGDKKTTGGLTRIIALTKELAALKYPGDTETAQAERNRMVTAAARRQPTGGGARGQASDIQTWRDELQQKLAAEGNFFADSKAEELAFWQSKVSATAAGSREQAQIENTIFQLRKQIAKQNETTAIEEQDFAIRAAQGVYSAELARAEAAVTLGKMTATEAVVQEQAALDKRWALDESYFEKKLAAAAQDLEETKRLEEQEFLDQQKMLAEKQALDVKAAEASKARWESLVSPLKSAFQSAAAGVAMGTQTLPQAGQNIGGGVAAAIIDKATSKLFDKLGEAFTSILPDSLKSVLDLGQDANTLALSANTTAVLANTAAVGGGALASAGGGAASAASAAGGFFSFLKLLLPFSRGGIVPAAAGGWALPSSFGSDSILAALTPGEMVLPVGLSQGLQGMIAGGVAGAGGGHIFNLNISAWDARSVMAAGPQIVAAINKATRNGAMIRS